MTAICDVRDIFERFQIPRRCPTMLSHCQKYFTNKGFLSLLMPLAEIVLVLLTMNITHKISKVDFIVSLVAEQLGQLENWSQLKSFKKKTLPKTVSEGPIQTPCSVVLQELPCLWDRKGQVFCFKASSKKWQLSLVNGFDGIV